MPVAERTKKYIELGKKWAAGHKNRMIKVPATAGGLGGARRTGRRRRDVNVTLIFSERQYNAARDAFWRGHQRRTDKRHRQDRLQHLRQPARRVHREGTCPTCRRRRRAGRHRERQADLEAEPASSGRTRDCRCKQEMIFASTGTKKPEDPPWKYVEAFAGSDIETNPPATNDAVQESGRTFTRQSIELPPADVLDEIDEKVDMAEAGRDADGRRAREVRRPAEGAAEADRGEAGCLEVTASPYRVSTTWRRKPWRTGSG